MGFKCIVATLYGTLWEHFLVESDVWSYRADAVLGVVESVPFEKYAFFSLQTLLVGLTWLAAFPTSPCRGFASSIIAIQALRPRGSLRAASRGSVGNAMGAH